MIAAMAFAIASEQAHRSILWLCDDDQQAGALAEATAALMAGPVVHIPASDALPGDAAPATPANVGRRLAALRALRRLGSAPVACIASGEAAAGLHPALMQDEAPLSLHLGGEMDPADLAAGLEALGYIADDRVDEAGEFAIRGEVIDLFPTQGEQPVRLDLAEGRITAIRTYDPVSQIGSAACDRVEIEPACEQPMENGVCLLDHLRPGAWGMTERAEAWRRRCIDLSGELAARGAKPFPVAGDELWRGGLKGWTQLSREEAAEPLPRFASMRSPLVACERFLRSRIGEGRQLLVAGSARDLRFLRPRLEKCLGLPSWPLDTWNEIFALPLGTLGLLKMPVDRGFLAPDRILLAAGDLLGSRAWADEDGVQGKMVLRRPDLRIGDLVVHEEYGVGRIAGLESTGEGEERIVLDYAGDSRRLVPVSEADHLWRYGGDGEAVSLDRLNGSSWQKRRDVVEQAVAQDAEALMALARKREALSAPVLDPDPSAYERFVAGFAFDETPDQARAIVALRDDLASGRPMDRLVIGDVGYGKTEVALRAAAMAALAGYQVVVAAPTTVLARQHLEVFTRRFAGTGVMVAGLSRLSSTAEKKSVKDGLADGSIGVVIGTGAVMAPSVRYARLGLVVIDEEQRFGAKDKARLRGEGKVHVLSLSATPIPRTLQAALVGLQAVSVIATSPARRQPIRTDVAGFDDAQLRAALLREKSRGGQSFVVVPRIEDMAPLAQRLARLVPDLAVVEAHGRMPPTQIDAAMVDFAAGQGDVLLATNIIEAGLDIPRANTMVVWRADRFGLAQLHQLRGRVGRGSRRGQVWLLSEGAKERTMERLRTLATFDRLGAGFDISLRDLDMRGGGDLSGESQAGHMKLIGVDLYQSLLDKALLRVRGESIEDWSPDLHLGGKGGLPEAWIPEADVRLGLYGRLARLSDQAALDRFEEELVDRFGPLPPPAGRLLERARLTHLARAVRIERVDAGPSAIALTPAAGFSGDLAALGLRKSEHRWLLAEALEERSRVARLIALLEALASQAAGQSSMT